MPETVQDKTVTEEELQVLAEEMSTRVKEYVVVHAKEGVATTVDDHKDVLFNDKNPPENLIVRYDMIFATADLRNLLKEHRAGRVKPLNLPTGAEPLHD